MSAVPSLPENVRAVKDSEKHEEQAVNGNEGHKFEIRNEPVDNHRPLKVIVVGAGFSGVYLGIRIPERLKNIELVIYEKNAGVGGTWWENRYPGCACDIPSHSYQYSFNPNPKWSALYAPSEEIRNYIQDTVKTYSVDRFIKLNHKVNECRYVEDQGKWQVKVEDCLNDTVFEDSADVLVHARGALNEISWPSIPGMESFEGRIMHSAAWDETYDLKNRKIGVIGSGSSSIQIVPQIQKLPGTFVSQFVRNRTWISPPFGQQVWDTMGIHNLEFTEEQKQEFEQNPEIHEGFRMAVEKGGNEIQDFTFKGTKMQQGARQLFESSMKEKLATKPEIFDQMVPSFAPGCRRLTPGPGYLEALTEPNVEFVRTEITGVEAHGLRTVDGRLHELDLLICATGFKTSAPPPYPVIGRLGKPLSTHWSDYPRTYMSVSTDGFPNSFFMLGPNGAIGAGSLTIMMETFGDYITKCIRKVQKENIKSMESKSDRVDDFLEYCRAYFPHTVYADNCRSWYKNERDEVTGLWPGSSMHCLEALASPRWEDFEYESRVENRLAWLGNGWTGNQKNHRHLAWYLYPEHLDVPSTPYPEKSEKYDAKPYSS